MSEVAPSSEGGSWSIFSDTPEVGVDADTPEVHVEEDGHLPDSRDRRTQGTEYVPDSRNRRDQLLEPRGFLRISQRDLHSEEVRTAAKRLDRLMNEALRGRENPVQAKARQRFASAEAAFDKHLSSLRGKQGKALFSPAIRRRSQDIQTELKSSLRDLYTSSEELLNALNAQTAAEHPPDEYYPSDAADRPPSHHSPSNSSAVELEDAQRGDLSATQLLRLNHDGNIRLRAETVDMHEAPEYNGPSLSQLGYSPAFDRYRNPFSYPGPDVILDQHPPPRYSADMHRGASEGPSSHRNAY